MNATKADEESRVMLVLESAALKGDLKAARDLATLESALSVTTNLDACPEAAEAYEAQRDEIFKRRADLLQYRDMGDDGDFCECGAIHQELDDGGRCEACGKII